MLFAVFSQFCNVICRVVLSYLLSYLQCELFAVSLLVIWQVSAVFIAEFLLRFLPCWFLKLAF